MLVNIYNNPYCYAVVEWQRYLTVREIKKITSNNNAFQLRKQNYDRCYALTLKPHLKITPYLLSLGMRGRFHTFAPRDCYQRGYKWVFNREKAEKILRYRYRYLKKIGFRCNLEANDVWGAMIFDFDLDKKTRFIGHICSVAFKTEIVGIPHKIDNRYSPACLRNLSNNEWHIPEC